MLNFCEIEQIKVLLDYYSLLSYDAHKLNNMLTEIIENNEPYRLSMLQIDGKELTFEFENGNFIFEKTKINSKLEIQINEE